MRIGTLPTSSLLVAATLAFTAPAASAAQCGNNAAGFNAWVEQFRKEATANGIRPEIVGKAMSSVTYNTGTIRADRGQKSFKLSFDQFMAKRGGPAIISRGKGMKQNYGSLFSGIERRYGVPAGPLLAIWGMETGFGGFLGKEHTLSAVATLAYDCRRSEFFTDQLYAALQLVGSNSLSVTARGAAHGEIGQTQFLPRNVVKFGVDGDGDGRVDLVGSRADALASTANFLRGHGWQPGAGYQPGQPNFAALQGWNAASVYQQAIAYIGARIDGQQ